MLKDRHGALGWAFGRGRAGTQMGPLWARVGAQRRGVLGGLRGRVTKGQGDRGGRAVQGIRGGALGCMEGRGSSVGGL